MRPEAEAHIGDTIAETLKKLVATMWPELCPESGPSFWLGLAKYLKIPYLGPTLSLGARATFWPTAWPQSGPNFNSTFLIFQFLFSNIGPNPGRILAMSRGPSPWLWGGIWGRSPGGHFGDQLGRFSGKL